MNGRIALKRCVTPRAPRSNAAFACAAVASVCPSEIVTPRSTSRSISAPAPGSSGASVISRTSPASRSRSRSARSGSRRDDAPCAPRRAGERNGPSRCTPRICGRASPRRDLTQRAEQLVLRARDQRRQKGRHTRLEQRVARDAVVGAARVEEVDPAEAVHLQVDEPGDGEPPAGTRQADGGHDPGVDLDVPRQEGAVDQCRCDAQSHRASLQAPPALVNTTSARMLEVGRFGLYHRAMAEIELDRVGKAYGSVRAVDEVSVRDRRR